MNVVVQLEYDSRIDDDFIILDIPLPHSSKGINQTFVYTIKILRCWRSTNRMSILQRFNVISREDGETVTFR